MNIRTSWISWGAWSDLIFLAVGGLLVLPALSLGGSEPFAGLPWDPHGRDGAGLALEIVAGVAAGDARDVLAVVCCALLVLGGFLLRLLTLRVGIYPPVHIPSTAGNRSAGVSLGG